MQIGIAVSVLVGGAPVDPGNLVDAVSLVPGVRGERADNAVWLVAEHRHMLGNAADVVVAWWREQGTGAVLRLDGEVAVRDQQSRH
jgi:hypothetical protein